MAILDFLKTKEDADKAKQGQKAAKKTAKVSAPKPDKSPKGHFDGPVKMSPKATLVGKATGFSYDAIKKPHISEKASFLSERNQYVFEVLPNFNKTEIKKAIEGIYGVNVLSVNIITIPPKKRRMGKVQGWRKEMTKAIVKIKEDQKIEIL